MTREENETFHAHAQYNTIQDNTRYNTVQTDTRYVFLKESCVEK